VVLKGAAALLAREVSLRATRDVDLYRRAGLMETEIAMREGLALDLGDWFTFDAGRSRQMTAGVRGLIISVTARIGIREWESFNVDLVGEAAGMTGEPDTVPALARIDLSELRQPGYRVWPLADHVADKLAATIATYGRSNRPSTRVRDLIDVVVLAHCAHVSADDAIAAVRAQTSRREIVLPGRFDIPDLDHWSRHYPREARKVRGLTEQALGDAVSMVRSFVDPILAGTATGSWDPVTLRWNRLL
jgi:hypothetical protein